MVFLTEVMECVLKRTVFFIHRGQVCSGVLTDVRFSKKRCPICVNKKKKKKNLLKDVICAVAAVHKIKTSRHLKHLIQAEANVHGLGV